MKLDKLELLRFKYIELIRNKETELRNLKVKLAYLEEMEKDSATDSLDDKRGGVTTNHNAILCPTSGA